MRSALSSVLVLALLGACARATSAPLDVTPGQSVQLATSQSARVTGSTVQVTFVGANDSRCPSDVVCVTAGDAVIALWFSGAGAARPDTVHLVMKPQSATYSGYLFEATDLRPSPDSRQPTVQHVLTLRITRAP